MKGSTILEAAGYHWAVRLVLTSVRPWIGRLIKRRPPSALVLLAPFVNIDRSGLAENRRCCVQFLVIHPSGHQHFAAAQAFTIDVRVSFIHSGFSQRSDQTTGHTAGIVLTIRCNETDVCRCNASVFKCAHCILCLSFRLKDCCYDFHWSASLVMVTPIRG